MWEDLRAPKVGTLRSLPLKSLKTASESELLFADALRACLAPGAFPPANHGCMSRTSGAKRS
jgi:hypothetical protein